MGFIYDPQTDLIYFSTDNTQNDTVPPFVYFGTLNSQGNFSSPVKILDYYDLSSTREQDFYYPKFAIHENTLHVFFSGSVYDKTDPNFRWFNGIYHGYRNLSGGGWNFEWVWRAALETEYLHLQDGYQTSDNRLALVLSYSNCPTASYCQQRSTVNLLSPTGTGPWENKIISADANLTACVTQSLNGQYNLFATFDPPNFIRYAKSPDGVSWQFVNIPLPTNFIRLSLGHNCLEQETLYPLKNAYALVSGLSPSQTSIANGHTVILAEIASFLLGYLDFSGLLSAYSPETGIFDYNNLVANFGTTQ